MRNSSCWMILVALLTITAPTAFADSFSIVFTAGPFGTGTPVDNSIISFTQTATGGVLDLGTVTYSGGTYTFASPLATSANPQADTYQWGHTKLSQFIFIHDLTQSTFSYGALNPFGTLQAFADGGSATVTLTTSALPEPSPVVLTLVGLGLLVVMRKRKALGLVRGT